MFTTVLVPHPKIPMLAWMNVWSYTEGYGVDYAYQVSPLVLKDWFDQGWRNWFMDWGVYGFETPLDRVCCRVGCLRPREFSPPYKGSRVY